MPVNNNLKPMNPPIAFSFDEKPETVYKNDLDAIKVSLVGAPTLLQIAGFLPDFVLATFAKEPLNKNISYSQTAHVGTEEHKRFLEREAAKYLYETMKGERLPTALETVQLTFCLDGISIQEATHILRHRLASFSADCSGEKTWAKKDALVPSAIENSPEFYERWKKIVEESKELYCDMINSKEVSIMNARSILPRCLETFYFMSMPLNVAIAFIKQRIDKQIQPETDNVVAYRMLTELCKVYPFMSKVIDIHQPAMYYVKTLRSGTNSIMYAPDKDSDIAEFNENDIAYGSRIREEINGTDKKLAEQNKPFIRILEETDKALEDARKLSEELYGI